MTVPITRLLKRRIQKVHIFGRQRQARRSHIFFKMRHPKRTDQNLRPIKTGRLQVQSYRDTEVRLR